MRAQALMQVLRRARHRLPWLGAGLTGAAVATAATAGFESTLSHAIAVAFFVPGIVYLADAIGTQSEAIAVRGPSLTLAGIGPRLAGELHTGMLHLAGFRRPALGIRPAATVIQDVVSLLVYFAVVRAYGL